MKKLLFIGIVALMVQSLGAVTLPSTSYSPYSPYASGGSSESSEVVFSSGSMVKGSYSSLGAGTVNPDVCTTETPGEPAFESNCSDCCDVKVLGPCEEAHGDDCDQLNLTCINSCMQGGSLPLDGGLSILLILSLAGGAAKVLRNRKS